MHYKDKNNRIIFIRSNLEQLENIFITEEKVLELLCPPCGTCDERAYYGVTLHLHVEEFLGMELALGDHALYFKM